VSDSTHARPVHLEGEADLDAFLAAHDRALVEFYTEGCGICASMEPVLGTVARADDDLAVGLVNPRDDPSLVERFAVSSVPLFVRFEDGEPVERLADGFVGAEELLAFAQR
jgi:thioredoxin-like negative regulator of GroEL